MKKCLNCGADNKNENVFCSTCGSKEFGAPFDDPATPVQPAAPSAPPVPPAPPIAPPLMPPRMPEIRKPFTFFDVLTILGFVSSIVGLWGVGFVLEPIALVASILGFFKGGRNKGLAAAGLVIAVIAFIIRLFLTLYDANIIGRWAVDGILFYNR